MFTKENDSKVTARVWPEIDMLSMDRELDYFREDVDGKKRLTKESEQKWLESVKAIRIGYHLGKKQVFVRPDVYSVMSEKLSFYHSWKAKRNFGINKGLEQIADKSYEQR